MRVIIASRIHVKLLWSKLNIIKHFHKLIFTYISVRNRTATGQSVSSLILENEVGSQT